MIALLASLAAAAPPEGVRLEDVFGWEDASNRLLDGPPGCWEVTGRAAQKVVGFVPPDLFSNGLQYEEVLEADLSGKLVDGVWSEFTWTRLPHPVGSVDRELFFLPPALRKLDVVPLVGSRPAEGGGLANVVRVVLDGWGGDMSTSLAEWDDGAGGVWLRREVPVRDKERAPVSKVGVFFPGGDRVPSRMDVLFPSSFRAGQVPLRFRVEDAQFHLRADPARQAAPTVESVSLLVVVAGVTAGFEQTIRYTRFAPCAPIPAPTE